MRPPALGCQMLESSRQVRSVASGVACGLLYTTGNWPLLEIGHFNMATLVSHVCSRLAKQTLTKCQPWDSVCLAAVTQEESHTSLSSQSFVARTVSHFFVQSSSELSQLVWLLKAHGGLGEMHSYRQPQHVFLKRQDNDINLKGLVKEIREMRLFTSRKFSQWLSKHHWKQMIQELRKI